ncbi:hypothetical protein QM565_18595 [Geitlerinema splendidum]|nr:hypothetical protein [Geitlerinema splendidum]
MEHFRPSPSDRDFGHATDAWHTHTAREPDPQKAHGRLSPRWISVGVGVSMVLFLLICAALGLMFVIQAQDEWASKQEIDTGLDYVQYAAQAKAELANVAWVDRDAGIVRTPIEEGMRSVVREYERLQGGGGTR